MSVKPGKTIEEALNLEKRILLLSKDEYLDGVLLAKLSARDKGTLTYAHLAFVYLRDHYNNGGYDTLSREELVMLRRVMAILSHVGDLSPDVVFAQKFEDESAKEEERE